jgi:2-polyprenyl-6-hydroxyphenyl methylase/3-demethylubiquinone-9 3-methyltransferase
VADKIDVQPPSQRSSLARIVARYAGFVGSNDRQGLFVGKAVSNLAEYARGNMRGMSPWRDVVDWVGGFPFEVAKSEEIFHFYLERGFQLCELRTCAGGIGCNEYVFERR